MSKKVSHSKKRTRRSLLAASKSRGLLGLLRKHAFTLIELLVVIAIIAILATMVTQALSRTRINARNTAAVSNVTAMGKSVEIFRGQTSNEGVISLPFGATGPDTLDSAGTGTLKNIFTGSLNLSGPSFSYEASVQKSVGPNSTYTYSGPASTSGPNGTRTIVGIGSTVVSTTLQPGGSSTYQPVYYVKDGSGSYGNSAPSAMSGLILHRLACPAIPAPVTANNTFTSTSLIGPPISSAVTFTDFPVGATNTISMPANNYVLIVNQPGFYQLVGAVWTYNNAPQFTIPSGGSYTLDACW